MALSTIQNNSFADTAVHGYRNLIINGNFSVSQRGTSFTTDNVYTLDRWFSGDGTGGTPARTLSQETFTLGQTDVPNAYYYLRHNQTGASTNGNSSLVQKIEDVTRFDGQTVTLSFYAKADAAMDIDVLFIQDFGTGGSPSSDVTLTETVSIGTSWTRYTVTKTLGSLSGKTLGSDGVNTSFLSINMVLQPTTTFTLDLALCQLEYGSQATPFEHRPFGDELARCQRYYEKSFDYNTAPVQNVGSVSGSLTVSGVSTTANVLLGHVNFAVVKRALPVIYRYNPYYAGTGWSQAGALDLNSATYGIGTNGFSMRVESAPTLANTNLLIHWVADSEL